jgi:hypothetical protein
MLKECKLALRITATAYEGELCSLMDAAAKDLTIAGVTLPGTVAFTTTQSGIQDTSTLTDALCQRAIFTYVRMHFGSPEDYERLRESYNVQKVQLMHASGYTDYGEPETGDDESEAEADGEG